MRRWSERLRMNVIERPAGQSEFLGIEFDTIDMASVVTWLSARKAEDDFGYVVTPNVDHIVRLDRDRDALTSLYTAAALRLCDSRVLAAFGRMVGVDLPVVPGSDLVAVLFASIAEPGDTIAIVGGRATSFIKLRAHYPLLDLQQIDAPMGLREDAAARAAIVAAQALSHARFTLIAVGSPQQEMLAFEMAAEPQLRGTALCIGASVDFIVGDQQRAPLRVQRAGMEWLWRLSSNPQRLWRRYLVDGPRIFSIVLAWRRHKRRGGISQ